ncbi:hypothetical protein LCGC14_1847160, partial [marine sediment metagenome]
MIDLSKIEEDLTSVIKLTNLQAKIFLLIVTEGKMTAKKISNTLRISIDDAYSNG